MHKINRIIKSKLPDCNNWVFFQTKCKINNFLTVKGLISSLYILSLIINFRMVVAGTPLIREKVKAFLRSKYVNNSEYGYSLQKELKVMTILRLKNIFCLAITFLFLKISPFQLPSTTTLKLA